jgi:hypothetical protein
MGQAKRRPNTDHEYSLGCVGSSLRSTQTYGSPEAALDWLPAEEAARLRVEFATELARLEAA